MDGLISISLIKSAKFDFAQLPLDGNTLCVGANGAGKTTLLRAVLFFYVANGRTLGINSNKKVAFSDYYFEYENSYIAYVYKKGDKYILVTVFKNRGVQFRFLLLNQHLDIESLFIENNRPLDQGELWQKMRKLGDLSNIIPNGVKYKEILYAKNYQMRHLSLFEAKEYQGFIKTLSNIFINSKVDADAIKKVIISSLQIEKKIDLKQTQRHLSTFKKQYEDIKNFTQRESELKQLLIKLSQYSTQKEKLQYLISTLANSKLHTINTQQEITLIISKEKNNLEQLALKAKEKDNLFTNRRDKKIGEKKSLNDKIKEIKEKKFYYEENNIDDKIREYTSLSQKEQQLAETRQQESFLLENFKSLEDEHRNLLKSLQNSHDSEQLNFEKQLLPIKQNYTNQCSHYSHEEKDTLSTLQNDYFDKQNKLQEQKNALSLKLEKINTDLILLEKEAFIFSEAQKHTTLTKEYDEIEQKIITLKNILSSEDQKLITETQIFNTNKENIQKNALRELSLIEEEIFALENLISPKENTLLKSIYETSNVPQLYLHFLNETILNAPIDCQFDQNTHHIFELNLSNFDTPQTELKQKQKNLNQDYQNYKDKFFKEENQLNRLFKKKEQQIYKEKRYLNEEIKSYQNKRTIFKTRIDKNNFIKNEMQLKFEEQKNAQSQILNEKLIHFKNQKTTLDEEETRIKQVLKNEQKSIKSKYTILSNALDKQYKIDIEEIEKSIDSLTKNYQKNRDTQEENYQTKLLSNGVDTQRLSSIQSMIKLLDNDIKKVQSYQEIITLYKRDKEELFKHLSQKEKLLKKTKEELSLLEISFKKEKIADKNIYDTQQTSIHNYEKEIILLNHDLEQLHNFEQNSSFAELLTWGIVYQENSDTEKLSALISIINQEKENYKNIENTILKQTRLLYPLFDNTLNIQRDLDDLVSAYNLKTFYEENSIIYYQEFLGDELSHIIKSIVDDYSSFITAQGDIERLIKKISKLFEQIDIGVIEMLSLRYSLGTNKILEIFSAINSEQEENPFGYTKSLFSQNENNQTMILLLQKLIENIEYNAKDEIYIEESFNLSFRVVENGNDSKYVESLDMIGSNGTDVLVKSMIYIAMLHIFKEQTTKKPIQFHVVLDEIGILSQRYLKELIQFANLKDILFINGAPDEKLIGTYKRVNLISNHNNISIAQELIIQ
jgi:hypothetical protein